MYLSSLIGSDAKPYLEYAWVCAPNATGQSIATNTITTLYLGPDGTGEIADTGNYGSLSAGTFPTGTASATSQITLAAGTYYFKVTAPTRTTPGYSTAAIISLYNTTDSAYVTRGGYVSNGSNSGASSLLALEAQFTITTSKAFEIRLLVTSSNGTIIVDNGALATTFTLATAGADQRTTIKLWKLS